MKGLKSTIALSMIPGFRAITNHMQGYVVGAIKLSKETNIVKTAMAAMGVVGAMKTVGPLVKIAKTLGLVQSSVGGTVFSILKIGAAAAVVRALYLVFDELFTLVNGGDTMIGRVLDQMGGVGAKEEFVKSLKNAWAALSEEIHKAGPEVAKFGVALLQGFADSLPWIIGCFKLIGGSISYVAQQVMALVGVLGNLPKAIKDNNFGKLSTDWAVAQQNLRDGTSKDLAKAWDGPFKQHYGSQFQDVPTVPAPRGGAGGAGGVVVNQTNKTEVTVHGVRDAKERPGAPSARASTTRTRKICRRRSARFQRLRTGRTTNERLFTLESQGRQTVDPLF